jgi:hypothetical protein
MGNAGLTKGEKAKTTPMDDHEHLHSLLRQARYDGMIWKFGLRNVLSPAAGDGFRGRDFMMWLQLDIQVFAMLESGT